MTHINIIALENNYDVKYFINTNDKTFEMDLYDEERIDEKFSFIIKELDEVDSWEIVDTLTNFRNDTIKMYSYTNDDTATILQNLLNNNVVTLDAFRYDRLDVMISEFQKIFPSIDISKIEFEQCEIAGGEV